jgi:WS/DGAT/MGAT family acyltransferase
MRAALRGPRQVLRGLVDTGRFLEGAAAAPSTPFNVEIGPHRRLAFVRGDLGDFKRVKNAHGGTVNDVVLSVVAGALGNYLRARGHDTDELEMRAMVPVSVRADEERGALGNRISAMMAPLPVFSQSPVERLRMVSETMGDLKGSGQAVGAELLTRLTDFAPTTIASQAARLQPAQRFFNLVVTNVPGPQFPLYLMGRRMTSIFPLVPLARRQALCVGIMSYDGRVDFGLVGDYDAMADLESFALDLEGAIAEVVATVPPAERDGDQPREPARTRNGAVSVT